MYGLRQKFRRLQSTASAATTLGRQFFAAPSENLATAEISSSLPPPRQKATFALFPPSFPSSNLHCLLAAPPAHRRRTFLLRGLVDIVR